MKQDTEKNIHDKYAPYWAAALITLCATGLSTNWINWGDFWKGYVLDMTGPAWTYILFRGLFTAKANNVWTRYFTPLRTLVLFVLVCVTIETMQYFNIYDATWDPWDFAAYFSILIPLFFIDKLIIRKSVKLDKTF